MRCFACLQDAAEWAEARLAAAGGSLGTPDEIAAAFARLEAEATL
jgi:hypothetical protein